MFEDSAAHYRERPMASDNDPQRRIVEAALVLAAEKGWRTTTMADVAARASVSLADIHARFPTRFHLLDGIGRLADGEVLARPESGAPAEAGDTPRDRLFDALMARFDALASHRNGIRAIVRALPTDPLGAAGLAGMLGRSMDWMLEAAGIAVRAPFRPIVVVALGGVWLSTMRVWMDDDTADLARTMAALDAGLRRAEGIGGSLLELRSAEPAQRGSESDA
jgi:AcrR family transcriptional regulator